MSSPHYAKVIHSCGVTCDVTMVMFGGGSLQYSLNFCPKVFEDLPISLSSQSTLLHLYLYIMPLFGDGIFIFWSH